MPSEIPARPIVFFDGDCAFCNRSVQLLLELDDDERLRFAPLQGETARGLLPEEITREATMSTMAIWTPDGALRYKSNAVIEILRQIGGPFALAIGGYAVPRALRDALYDFVALRRRKIARKAFCAMPDPGDRDRFLP